MTSILILFVAGAIGALVKEIIQDNKLTLPKKVDGEFALGFLGSCIIGGVAGYLVDGDPVTAGLAGYAGLSVIANLLAKKNQGPELAKNTIAEIIRKVAENKGIDPELAVRVADCESGLNPAAVNLNKDGSKDRGLYQINDKWHPEVSDKIAFDIVLSTQFFCQAFIDGHLDWWKITKKCWEK